MLFSLNRYMGAGDQRPLRRHLVLSIILVIKLMRKIWNCFCLGILIATSLELYRSGNSPTLEYNISVFFDKRWYLWIAPVNYWTHQSSQQLAREEQLFLMWLTRENKHLGLSNHCLVLTWPEKLIALFLAVSSFIETRQTMNFNVKYFLFATSLFYIFLYFSGEKYLYKM